MASVTAIEYRGRFDFGVSAQALWSAIEDTEQFERWWPWLRDFTLDGGTLASGSVMKGVVAPPLPYRMRIDVELLDCHAPKSIDAFVHGDLDGPASLRISVTGADSCQVEAEWTIEMMQAPMRLAARFAHPLLRWGHDCVVDTTVRSFRRHLGSPRAV